MLIALHKGTGFISRTISWQTRGPYSHASVVIDNGTFTAIEAREFKGVRQIDLYAYQEEIDLFDVTTSPLQRDAIIEWLKSQLGKPYDYTMVVRFLSRRQETRESTGKWFCSELAFAAFQKFGIPLLARTEPWEVSPSLLARSPHLRFCMRLNPKRIRI